MILADRVRQYVLDDIIQPARLKGLPTVRLRAGDVHQALGLQNRMPAVCGALDAEKFLSYAQVLLVSREGPLQGSTTTWVFELK
jgi:5-methylcytosine-specific restriction protein B